MADEIVERLERVTDKLSKIGRVRLPAWTWAVYGASLFAIGGGCVAYIDHRVSESERKQTERIDQMTLNLRQVMSMWKDDPKNFDRTGKQIEEIRDWIREHK